MSACPLLQACTRGLSRSIYDLALCGGTLSHADRAHEIHCPKSRQKLAGLQIA
jgi:hypothetical protein